MSNKKNRSGTSQNERALPVLRGDYISVEERSLVDLLMYLREYAEKVRFYSEDNRHNGFWSEFLEFSDDGCWNWPSLLKIQRYLVTTMGGWRNTPNHTWPYY